MVSKAARARTASATGSPATSAGAATSSDPLSIDCQPKSAKGIGVLSIGFKPATTGTTTTQRDHPVHERARAELPLQYLRHLGSRAVQHQRRLPRWRGLRWTALHRRQPTPARPAPPPRSARTAASAIVRANRPNRMPATTACAPSIPPTVLPKAPAKTDPSTNVAASKRIRGCSGNADCNPPPTGNCGSCAAGQACVASTRQCFLDPIVRHGVANTQTPVVAATFCIPPTSSQSVNQVAGLPGPGALELPTRVFKINTLCGNNTLNAGESCDGTADAACPGACQIDCQCPGCFDEGQR